MTAAAIRTKEILTEEVESYVPSMIVERKN